MELLEYIYFCSQKSIIKAGNNNFRDLINAPRFYVQILISIVLSLTGSTVVQLAVFFSSSSQCWYLKPRALFIVSS